MYTYGDERQMMLHLAQTAAESKVSKSIKPSKHLAITGICSIGVLAITGCTSLAQAETMVIYNDSTADSFIRMEQKHGIGDQILWNSTVETLEGDVIGDGAGHCTQVDAAKNYYCGFVVHLEDRGRISGQGVQRTEPFESSFPITGGTGEFEGIVGEIKSTPVEDRARFVYEIEYRIAD